MVILVPQVYTLSGLSFERSMQCLSSICINSFFVTGDLLTSLIVNPVPDRTTSTRFMMAVWVLLISSRIQNMEENSYYFMIVENFMI